MERTLSELSGHLTPDPDAQATVTDFLDYTEFFPSDLFRSLTLITNLDEASRAGRAKIHDLTKTYGELPSVPHKQRPNAQQLRKDISITLDQVLRNREASAAEAARLCTAAKDLHAKLQSIHRKLLAMPKPPSRDPSPVAQRLQLNTRTRKAESDRPTRLALTSGLHKADTGGVQSRPKNRIKRVIVPGEVLPPFDPGSPGASDVSESESERAPSLPAQVRKIEKVAREKTPKAPKVPAVRPPKPERVKTQEGFGTNAHSQKAGVSVSNVQRRLQPPPADAQPGSKHRPWLELTQWELNILRKKMKKSAIWMPSDTMVRRGLEDDSRGYDNFIKARAHARATGTILLDEKADKAITFTDPAQVTEDPSESKAIADKVVELSENTTLTPAQVREQAARDAAAEIEASMKKLSDAASMVRSFAPRMVSDTMIDPALLSPPVQVTPKPTRKRKQDASPLPGDGASDPKDTDQHPAKKLKLVSNASEVVSKPPILRLTSSKAPPNTSLVKREAPAEGITRTSRSAAGGPESSTPVPNQSKSSVAATASQRTPKAASAEPPIRRITLRHGSEASVTGSSMTSGATKHKGTGATPASALGRRTRPVPGVITSDGQEGGAKVSVGSRKAAPARSVNNKKVNAAASAGPKERQRASTAPAADLEEAQASTTTVLTEVVDPNEPRYCLCDRISFGEMIACDNDRCPLEWFHFECVGLTELPRRTQKWFCPICRKKMGVDASGTKLK